MARRLALVGQRMNLLKILEGQVDQAIAELKAGTTKEFVVRIFKDGTEVGGWRLGGQPEGGPE